MNFPKRIINSFQTSWNKLAKLSIRKLTLTSQTLYIQFHDVGTYMNYCLFLRNRLRYRSEISHVYSRDKTVSENNNISISTRCLIWTQNLMAGHIFSNIQMHCYWCFELPIKFSRSTNRYNSILPSVETWMTFKLITTKINLHGVSDSALFRNHLKVRLSPLKSPVLRNSRSVQEV